MCNLVSRLLCWVGTRLRGGRSLTGYRGRALMLAVCGRSALCRSFRLLRSPLRSAAGLSASAGGRAERGLYLVYRTHLV